MLRNINADQPTDEEILNYIGRNLERAYAHLECSGCRMYCHPPLRVCSEDHPLCDYCYQDEPAECKKCKSPESAEIPILLERIHDLLNFRCRYRKFGCTFNGNGSIIVNHTNRCNFYVSPCFDDFCNWIGKPSNFLEHYRKYHPHKLLNLTDTQWITEISEEIDNHIIKNLIFWDNEVFAVILAFFNLEKYIGVVATNFGFVRNIEEYNLSVEMYSKEGHTWIMSTNFEETPNESLGSASLDVPCNDIDKFKKTTNPSFPYQMSIRIHKTPSRLSEYRDLKLKNFD